LENQKKEPKGEKNGHAKAKRAKPVSKSPVRGESEEPLAGNNFQQGRKGQSKLSQ